MKNLHLVLAGSLLISTSMAYATVPLAAMNNKIGQCQLGQTCSLPQKTLGYLAVPIKANSQKEHAYECVVHSTQNKQLYVETYSDGDLTMDPAGQGTLTYDIGLLRMRAEFQTPNSNGDIKVLNVLGTGGATVTCQQTLLNQNKA
ncbi:MAG: hypothetical protein K0S08_1472 [Gammaproteobacteria bacterium]|jgi:hypothetical protein|nr:hypothetical protein [Gammaproteobacteria bacterium]